jgi:hypothetical protein
VSVGGHCYSGNGYSATALLRHLLLSQEVSVEGNGYSGNGY